MENLEKYCQHKNCKDEAVFRVTRNDEWGDKTFYCRKHLGEHIFHGDVVHNVSILQKYFEKRT